MKRRLVILAVGMLVDASFAWATTPLPPPEDLAAAIDGAPFVAMARAGLEEASASAAALRAGPHEWTLRLEAQARDVRRDQAYPEWYSGLDHGVRWFGKQRLDESSARLQEPLAHARVADAVREQHIIILEAWFDCLTADRRAALAKASVKEARAIHDMAALRWRLGDASRADADLAVADLAAAEAEQRSSSAVAAGTIEALRLLGLGASCRGVTIDALPPAASPAPPPVSPTVTLARLQADQARLAAQRAQADQRPDPTLGVRLGSELGGTDRLAMLSVSVPLGGSRRRAEAAAALARARAQDAAVLAAERSEAARRLSFDTLAVAGRSRLASGEQDLAARRQALDSLVRAYSLGDGDLATISQVRRLLLQAALAVELARIEIWRGSTLGDLFAGPASTRPAALTEP